MASDLKGSANVAGQIGSDCAGQDVDLTDDTQLKVDGDVGETGQGLTMVSPDGSVFKIAVTNAGGYTATAFTA